MVFFADILMEKIHVHLRLPVIKIYLVPRMAAGDKRREKKKNDI